MNQGNHVIQPVNLDYLLTHLSVTRTSRIGPEHMLSGHKRIDPVDAEYIIGGTMKLLAPLAVIVFIFGS
ncbi:MAG: hypothetical protein HN936_14145 [Bacteroidetes bacterium]|jgi:hypothetical protein|nr:hypothetical protein [Bacteroidota bacterium]